MPDDYLWNREGEPDPEIERLENILGSLRHKGSPPSRWGASSRYWLVAAAAVVVAVLTVLLVHRSSWSVEPAGEVRLDARALTSAAGIGARSVVETGPDSRATLKLGILGTATLLPDTRVSVERTAISHSQLGLEHGTIKARIGAPPRLFYVSTPYAEAIDLGCAYELSIDAGRGNGWLRVTHGWVALEGAGGRVYVPRGSTVRILGKDDVSVPIRDDANAAFRDAAESAVTALPAVTPEQLRVIERTVSGDDLLTIWHLLRRADDDSRQSLARMIVDAGPDLGADAAALARGDEREIARVGKRLGVHETRWWAAWARQGFNRLKGGTS